jgi:prepilin peptidase CpaA
MIAYRVLSLCPLLGLLIYAAAQDLRTRKIRNWLTLCLVVTGIVHNLVSPAAIGLSSSLLGLLAGFGLPLALFIIGALGGGDVKLLAGVGAWLGAANVVWVFLAAAVVGMVIVLVQCAATGRLKLLLGNTFSLVVSFLHAGEGGLKQATEIGKGSRSVDRPLPYAVPVLVAVVGLLVMN